MTAIMVRAGVAAGLAALALSLSRGTTALWLWEALLLAVIVLQAREIPGESPGTVPSLLTTREPTVRRLPRPVVGAEIAAADALSGHPGRERRLHPMLARVASHRLDRHGVGLDSPAALAYLERPEWGWLTGRDERPLTGPELERLVTRLEEL